MEKLRTRILNSVFSAELNICKSSTTSRESVSSEISRAIDTFIRTGKIGIASTSSSANTENRSVLVNEAFKTEQEVESENQRVRRERLCTETEV